MKKDCSFQVTLQEGEIYEDLIIIFGVIFKEYRRGFWRKKLQMIVL